MNVLAFDTCFGAVSAAVLRREGGGGRMLAERYEARTEGHAERLLPIIAETLGEAGLGLDQVDRIVVTIGPGSFTGVRVGVAAARALALATSMPAVGMSSLAVMADEARRHLGDIEGPLMVAVDARRGMVYAQLFTDGRVGEPQLLHPAQAAALVGNRPTTMAGSGAALVASEIGDTGGRVHVELPDLQPHARSLALRAFDLVPAHPLTPLYLRRPDAKLPADPSLPRVVS